MPAWNINLTERFDRFIEAEVRSGRFGDASDVVRESLRLMERRKQEESANLKLRGAVRKPRHFLLYRRRGENMIEVTRLLHNARDLERRIPGEYGSDPERFGP